MNIPSLGEARFTSTRSHTVDDNIRIPEQIELGAVCSCHDGAGGNFHLILTLQ